MNYTKGEWKVEQEEDKLIKFPPGTASCKHALGHPPTITIWTPLEDGFYKSIALVEEVGNAHLIAAAPDMYEALVGMRRWGEEHTGKEHSWEQLYKALAKAEGKCSQ